MFFSSKDIADNSVRKSMAFIALRFVSETVHVEEYPRSSFVAYSLCNICFFQSFHYYEYHSDPKAWNTVHRYLMSRAN